MLERQVGRPRWQPTDRLVLAAISRVLPRPDWRSLTPSPETLLRSHRELVRRKWAGYRRRRRRRRPNARSKLHDLILQLARENEGWGYRRIVGELRRVHLAGCTYSPSAEWVVQQARNLAWRLQDGALKARFPLRDRDTKFTVAFDEVFKSEGVEVYPVTVPGASGERLFGALGRLGQAGAT